MFKNLSRQLNNARGFTLIEILIVIVIVGIVAGVSVGVINPAQQQRTAADASIASMINKINLSTEGFISAYARAPNEEEFAGSLDTSINQKDGNDCVVSGSPDNECLFTVNGIDAVDQCDASGWTGSSSSTEICHFRYIAQVNGTQNRYRIYIKSHGLNDKLFVYDNFLNDQIYECPVTVTDDDDLESCNEAEIDTDGTDQSILDIIFGGGDPDTDGTGDTEEEEQIISYNLTSMCGHITDDPNSDGIMRVRNDGNVNLFYTLKQGSSTVAEGTVSAGVDLFVQVPHVGAGTTVAHFFLLENGVPGESAGRPNTKAQNNNQCETITICTAENTEAEHPEYLPLPTGATEGACEFGGDPTCYDSGHSLAYDVARTIPDPVGESWLKVVGDARNTLSAGTFIMLEGWDFEMITSDILYPRYGPANSLVGINPHISHDPSNRIPAGTKILICDGDPPQAPLEITSSFLPPATADIPYGTSLVASGGVTPYSWNIQFDGSGINPGISIDATGKISGTPTIDGAFRFTVNLSDSFGASVAKSFLLTVLPGEEPQPPPPNTDPDTLVIKGRLIDRDTGRKPPVSVIGAFPNNNMTVGWSYNEQNAIINVDRSTNAFTITIDTEDIEPVKDWVGDYHNYPRGRRDETGRMTFQLVLNPCYKYGQWLHVTRDADDESLYITHANFDGEETSIIPVKSALVDLGDIEMYPASTFRVISDKEVNYEILHPEDFYADDGGTINAHGSRNHRRATFRNYHWRGYYSYPWNYPVQVELTDRDGNVYSPSIPYKFPGVPMNRCHNGHSVTLSFINNEFRWHHQSSRHEDNLRGPTSYRKGKLVCDNYETADVDDFCGLGPGIFGGSIASEPEEPEPFPTPGDTSPPGPDSNIYPLEIPQQFLGGAVQGVYYRKPLIVRGGLPPHDYSIISGNYDGLSMDDHGHIVGTPRSSGTYRFTVRVEDTLSNVATKEIELPVFSVP